MRIEPRHVRFRLMIPHNYRYRGVRIRSTKSRYAIDWGRIFANGSTSYYHTMEAAQAAVREIF